MEILGFPIYELILFIVVGIAVGFIGGYAGIAGAPFMILFLTLVLGYTQHEAQGTTLAVMLGPMSLFGVIALWNVLKPYLKYAVIGTLTYVVFSYVGGTIAYLFESNMLQILFGIFLIIISIQYFLDRKTETEKPNQKPIIPLNYISMTVVGAFVGGVGGMFGIGASVLMIPIFTSIFKLKKDVARVISLAILLPPVSLGAVIKYCMESSRHHQSMWWTGDVNWLAVIIIFVTFFVVNYFGAKVGKSHSHKTFSTIFSIILLALGITTIILAIFIKK